MYYKGYKFRIYPTEEQKVFIHNACGQARFIYNWGLGMKKDAYEKDKTTIDKGTLDKMFRDMRNNDESKAWLKDVSSRVHEYAMINLDKAYKTFFKNKKGFPKFKSKFDRNQSAQACQRTCRVDFEKSTIDFTNQCKGIKAKLHCSLEGKPKTFTISVTPTGKYYVSICCEIDGTLPTPPKVEEASTIGIDLGIKTFAVGSDGTDFENPKYLAKSLKRLKRLQRRMSKCTKGSNNREKMRKRVASLHEKISAKRKGYINSFVDALTLKYNTIVIEDLNVKGLLKNRNLAKAISDVGWGMTRITLENRCLYRGVNLIKVNRFFASSKTCSCCGHKNTELKLKDRGWTCSNCETEHDRDFNASTNIKVEGLRIARELQLT